MQQELISVIIPVYNVEPYLDQCIESVVNQTYRNLEIIIIYDECPDHSLEICREWEKNESRICLVINKKRNGLGEARNLGLSLAGGEYIVYLDSDDWMKEDFIEALYREISASGAEYVSSKGFYAVKGDQNVMYHAVPAGRYDTPKMREALLLSDHVCAWKKMYRKKWLDENRLKHPALFSYEDWGMYPTILRQAHKVSVIDETGMYYNWLRDGCLSGDAISEALLLNFEKSLVYALDYLQSHGLRKERDEVLGLYVIRDFYTRWNMAKEVGNTDALRFLGNMKRRILEKEFGAFDFEKYEYVAYGGFSLRWEIQGAVFNPKKHHCFSSLISVMSKSCRNIRLRHKNSFRQEQLEADVNSALLDTIKNMSDNGLLFIDFVEERNDVLELEDGGCLAMSEAFYEATKEESLSGQILKYGNVAYMELWKERCLEFIQYVKKYLKAAQVIYVANRMALSYGDFNEIVKYKNEECLLEINKTIMEMERFFIDNFPGIRIIHPDGKYAFTDKDFRWGCEPQYMNSIYYARTAFKIFSEIKKMDEMGEYM